MKFSLHVEQKQVSAEEPVLQHLLIRLASPPVDESTPHTPLHIALAIDRSKSMHGEKLESVIEAANALVNWLTRSDSLAVIAYDTNVEVIQPLLPLTDKFSVTERIRSIRAGSSTNLSGGWLQALRIIEDGASADEPAAVRRVILLTDGMANAGIVNPTQLRRIARDHFERKISTTTIGFGRDFSEMTLREIAGEGGGNFYFIEGPEQAHTVFFQEFGEIAALLGQGLEIRLRPGPGVTVKELLHEIPHERRGDELILRPGDIRSDDLMNLVLVLEVDGSRLDPERPAVTAECSFYNIRQGARMERLSAEVSFQVGTPTGDFDLEVRLEALIASTGRALLEASRLWAERDLVTARELIRHKRLQIQECRALDVDLLSRLDERLEVTERNLDQNLGLQSKRLLAEADAVVRRNQSSGCHDRILEIALAEQLDLYRCPDLKGAVRRAMENGYRFAVFDMTDLSYVDSSGIGALIQIFNWLKSRGGLLVLSNVQSGVEHIFRTSKLDEFFVLRDSSLSARMLIEELLAGQGE